MLPKALRLSKPADFAAVLKSGRRAGTRQLAVHVLTGPGSVTDAPPRVGFVVSSKVGNSVVRHRVTRRLRAQVQLLLADLADGTDVVVRALPAAATATSSALAADLRYALRKVGSAPTDRSMPSR